ncbi:tetratricopeptide repeat protein [Carboxylicivirga sp. RSCT41]|uniref:tetratricopeptide repeat protein n=1 Tax=Carboxylicivirga agarovorans TaxID=3417570 RepID=UPI003D33F681
MKRLILFLILECIYFNVKSLTAQELPDSLLLGSDIISQAIHLHDEEKYEEAISKYMEVSDCDLSYPLTCYEMALTYSSMGNDSLALEKCYEALDLDYQVPAVYVLIGSIYDDNGQHKKSLEVLQEAAARWPYNQNVLYNLGVTQINAGLYVEAEKTLQQSVLIDPFHGSSHNALGDVNFRMGRAAQAYLIYSFRLLLYPSINNITVLQDILTGRSDKIYQPYLYPYPAGYNHEHWDRLKHLVQSELAFHDDFPYDYDVSYAITRQTYMLLSETRFVPEDQSLYNQFYARFFQQLMQDVGFETYLNYMLKNTNSEKVKKWRESNEEKLDQFITWAQGKIVTGREYTFSYELEQKDNKIYHYDEGELWAVGSLVRNSDPVRQGPWSLINGYGRITEKRMYENGKQQGEGFIYWDTDKLKQHLFFTDGEFDGKCITYYENGNVSGEYPMKNGNYHGVRRLFSPGGKEVESIQYNEGDFDGPYFYADMESGYSQQCTYKQGKLEGAFNETWLNGKLKMTSTYHEDKLEGKYETFYKNGVLENESSYKNGFSTDTLREFYANGQLKQLASLDDSARLMGANVFYNRKGILIAIEEGYDKGLLNGARTEYREDGSKNTEFIYENDSLTGIRSYDPEGNIFYQSDIEGEILDYKSYYFDGVLFEEGTMKNNERNGLWKKYNPQGGLLEELQYLDGMVHGSVKTYFSNGQLKLSYACDSNRVEGLFAEYFKNGNVCRTGWFAGGEAQGLWKSYYINGALEVESFYKDDVIRGKRKIYTPQGKIVREQYYDEEGRNIRVVAYNEKGEKTVDLDLSSGSGHLEEYFSNGEKRRDLHYKDFERHGKQLIYFPNGQLESEESFISGLEDGISKGWTHDGQLRYEYRYMMNNPEGKVNFYKDSKVTTVRNYELGLMQDVTTRYNSNGSKYSTTEYEDDEIHGYRSFYSPEGQLIFRERYVYGFLRGISYEAQGGQYSEETLLGQDKNKVVCYYTNKKKSASFTIVNGNYEGLNQWYYPSGKLYRERSYESGLQQGVEKWYYPSGKVKEQINWLNGEREGQYRFNHENGKVKEEGSYVCDQKTGDWKYYSADGKLLRKLTYFNGDVYGIEEL